MAEALPAARRRSRFGVAGTAAACIVGCCAIPVTAGLGIGAVAGCAALLLGASVMVVAALGATGALSGHRLLRRRARRVGPVWVSLMSGPSPTGDAHPLVPTRGHTPAAPPSRPTPLHVWLAVGLIASAGLFAVGVVVERGHDNDQHTESIAHSEDGESGGDEAEHDSEQPGASESGADEQVLGINPEAGPLVALVVVASILLAGAVGFRPERQAVVLAVLFCLAAAAFDVAEIAHQMSNSEAGLTVLAGLVACTHIAAATVGLALRRAA